LLIDDCDIQKSTIRNGGDMRHTLVALVEDKPGVLNRVASLFRRRAFNIESLTVGHTDQTGISRMTIVVDSNETNAERVTAYLHKLINVIYVSDLAEKPSVSRDLALVKVSVTAANRTEVLQLADVYRARIVDVANESLIVEVTGTEDKIDSCVEVLRPFGIVEMVRTGEVSMARGSQGLPLSKGTGLGNSNGNGLRV
jgi:acetolactate synthase-1/3 small subunit